MCPRTVVSVVVTVTKQEERMCPRTPSSWFSKVQLDTGPSQQCSHGNTICWISAGFCTSVVAVVIIRCMDRVADFPGKKPPKLQSFAFRKPQFQPRREQRVLQASQTKGVGNRHILCPTERSSRINECLEMESDVNASPKLFCPRCQLFGVPMPRHELQKLNIVTF